MDENISFERGDVVFVGDSNGLDHGHVIRGNHPAVVIQNDRANGSSPNIVVAFITSQMKRLDLPTHVVLQHYDNLKPCVVMTEQLATVDKEDVLSYMAHLRDEDMVRVNRAVIASLQLEED